MKEKEEEREGEREEGRVRRRKGGRQEKEGRMGEEDKESIFTLMKVTRVGMIPHI